MFKNGTKGVLINNEHLSVEETTSNVPENSNTTKILSNIDIQQWKHSIAGASAGFASAFVTCPLDVVKTRIQNQSLKSTTALRYKGPFHTLKRIYMEEGIRGNFRGLFPTLLGYLPAWTIYFSTYARFKDSFTNMLNTSSDSTIVHILAAMLAGVISTTSTNPLWVVKTRLMTQNSQSSYYYGSTWNALYMIFKLEGIKGFYRGLSPSLLGVSHVAIQFPLYERFKSLVIKGRLNEDEKI
jgi:solute carrier family 25 folate transporter 32